ncbi:hypothetical protein HDA32_003610 [Spinactinospora alkalitolerans]|uniref:Flavodoxin-like domain-containing protein n=1 Tax=Spinactinospora alkalitolerans TaxID=687207 RepID=A0A852U3G3_9ACTN|nr:hypothetical protein [Spinactinospora alkalitolerans]NYE48490.1 hypothetical protein [Spinactinospora alkalitolerans]
MKTNVAVVFHSGYGHTQRQADDVRRLGAHPIDGVLWPSSAAQPPSRPTGTATPR